MKKLFRLCVLFFLIGVMTLGMCSCRVREKAYDVFEDAIYTEDMEFGQGQKTLVLQMVVDEKKVTFTIHTDKSTVGEALTEHKLIEGDKGPYGMYVKKVNGITADYDTDKSYWAFEKNGESMMTGVDGTTFKNGEMYQLIYTK